VADDLVHGVEVIEGQQQQAGDDDVDDGSAHSDLGLVDDPDIAGDAAAYLTHRLLLAVTLAYFRTGKTFIKLRLNM
jgi:hypothetical protein